jgi:transposase
MADPLRHRQTKGAATDMVDLRPPRHIPTLPEDDIRRESEFLFRCYSDPHMGRPSKLNPAQQQEARQRRDDGATLEELASSYNVGEATIRRATRAA